MTGWGQPDPVLNSLDPGGLPGPGDQEDQEDQEDRLRLAQEVPEVQEMLGL